MIVGNVNSFSQKKLGPRSFHISQVVRIIHNTACIGVLIVNLDTEPADYSSSYLVLSIMYVAPNPPSQSFALE
jgi:hypothetical protein